MLDTIKRISKILVASFQKGVSTFFGFLFWSRDRHTKSVGLYLKTSLCTSCMLTKKWNAPVLQDHYNATPNTTIVSYPDFRHFTCG